MKKIILCADDYGLYDQVCSAILNLIEHHRISATGCMVNMPCWNSRAKDLIKHLDTIDVGLHLNLTEGNPLTKEKKIAQPNGAFKPLKQLIINCYLHRLNADLIKAEIKAQIQCFYNQFSKWPAFIDGHQHVQQLPIIRQALLEVYFELGLDKQPCYIRVSKKPKNLKGPQLYAFKAWIIHLLGGATWQSMLKDNNIPHNQDFSGIYDFSQRFSYRELFNNFITHCAPNTLIMCHPSTAINDDVIDPIANARINEYQYLSSDAFLEDCNHNGIVIDRFKKTPTSFQLD